MRFSDTVRKASFSTQQFWWPDLHEICDSFIVSMEVNCHRRKDLLEKTLFTQSMPLFTPNQEMW